jgi:membrane associated rhomboid family serine protease
MRAPLQRHAREPLFLAPPGTLWLSGSLVAVFLVLRLAGEPARQWARETFAFVPGWFLAQFMDWGPEPSFGGMLPLVSHAFLHFDALHIAFNAGLLLAFGSFVERRLGLSRFLLLFLLAVIAGALAQLAAEGPVIIAMFGASGGVFGMIGATTGLLGRDANPLRRRQGVVLGLAFMGVNLLFAVSGIGALLAEGDIAWQAHIGGFVAGLALVFLPGIGRRT